MKKLRPLNDVIFKKIFGEKKDKELLMSFLNAILTFEVVDLEIQEEKLTIETLESKQGILDIKAKTEAGEKINIEVSIKKANEKLELLAADSETRRMYELREKQLSDETTRIEGAIEEGLEKGKEEGLIEVAYKLLRKGNSVDFVCEVTSLSREKILELKNNMN